MENRNDVLKFRFPTDIWIGPNAVDSLPRVLSDQKLNKPLVVTDEGFVKLPVFVKLADMLKSHQFSCSIFSDCHGNPEEWSVKKGVDAYKQGDCDCLILVGGGSAIDVGKAIALMVHNPGELFDYEDDKPNGRLVTEPIPFMVAIPTTAGTGSEVGGSSVISRNDSHEKVIIWSPKLIPNLVLADPYMTIGLPPHLTAATGIDALTHNLEAYISKNTHPMCDGIALEGIRLAFENLEKAYFEPENVDARTGMLMSSMMGAVAFQKGLGVTHSCAHALSTCFDLHHGLANAMMLIPSMMFNFSAVEEKIARLCHLVFPSFSKNKNTKEFFINELVSLKKSLNIPRSLRELDVVVSPRLIEVALADPCHANNPIPCMKNDFENLFAAAMSENGF